MHIFRRLKAAIDDESGAITVEWVVLTASVVIVGALVVATVAVGVGLHVTKINNTVVSSAADLSNY